MKFNPFWENGKTLDSRIMMLSPDIVMGKKEWVGMPVGALPHQPK
jgi:hypothetical protein